MAKELVTWCSLHFAEDERIPGSEEEVTINGKTRLIDLCPECKEEYFGALEQILDEHGQTRKRKQSKRTRTVAGPPAVATASNTSGKYSPNSDGKYECTEPFCGRVFDKPQGLGRHLTSHGN